MKPSIAALLLLLSAGLAQADVGVYHGNQVVKTTSSALTSTQPERLIQVVDWEHSQMVQIRFGVKQAKKTFTVSEATPLVITETGDARVKKRIHTILALARTDTDLETGDIVVTSLLQSGFHLVTGNPSKTENARPRLLKQTASRVDVSGAANGPNKNGNALVEIRGTLHLLAAETRLSNQSGDDLAAAVARVVEGLLAKGFVDLTVYEEAEE